MAGPKIVRGNGTSVWIFESQADERAALVAVQYALGTAPVPKGMTAPIRELQLELFGQ